MIRPRVVAHQTRCATTLVALVVAITTLAGCDSDTRDIHGDGDGPLRNGVGPLSATSGEGLTSLVEPEGVRPPWYASFGSYKLCVRDPAAHVVLERVGWTSANYAPPLSVQPVLRFVDKTTPNTTPFASFHGKPWDPYDDERMPGRFSKRIAARVISQRCSDFDDGLPRPFEELVFVVKASKKGAELTDAYVDYSADGKPYRLMIRWTMIACGSAIEARGGGPQDDCPKDRLEHPGDN